jgi:flagellar assembly protein FliH
MSYQDLLRALDEEAAREAAALREASSRDAEQILEEARRVVAAERERALAAARADHEAALARTRAALAREAELALLALSRRWLDEVKALALARLAGRAAELVPRLGRELLARAGAGPFTLVVHTYDEAVLRAELARDPAVAARATVVTVAARPGGVQLAQDGAVLDDTLEARVERAWPELEPRLAALLAGERHGAV